MRERALFLLSTKFPHYTSRMSKPLPQWLVEAREFCRKERIQVVGWGPNLITVQPKSAAQANEIAAQLELFGLKPVADDMDVEAGLLSLSPNPDAVRTKVASFDVSRRRWDEQIEPLIWAGCALAFLVPALQGSERYPFWVAILLGIALTALFLWDAIRIWGWRLEILPQGLRIRRRGRWSTFQWEEIRSVDSMPAELRNRQWRLRNQEVVVLKLARHSSERLGTFSDLFARNLRDRLRAEIEQRRK